MPLLPQGAGTGRSHHRQSGPAPCGRRGIHRVGVVPWTKRAIELGAFYMAGELALGAAAKTLHPDFTQEVAPKESQRGPKLLAGEALILRRVVCGALVVVPGSGHGPNVQRLAPVAIRRGSLHDLASWCAAGPAHVRIPPRPARHLRLRTSPRVIHVGEAGKLTRPRRRSPR